MKFTEYNLPQFILDAIKNLGFETTTEIQEKSLPIIRDGNDMVGKSKTGSGKTFAYGIPAIEKVDTTNKNTQILIISPTRELASQICDELRKITGFIEGCRVVPVFGGSNMVMQIKALRSGARIVVGTPGRLMDHLERKTLNLKHLKMLVLDEADEMLNMGFKEDIETILKSVNEDHQTVMFSATMPTEILKITKNYMKEPQFVEIEEKELDSQISQKYLLVGLKEKQKALNYILETQKPRLSIVFSNTKRMVETIVKNLTKEGYSALGLHGDMRQNERKRVMQHIKSLTENTTGINLLVASDVAARGIDISNVDMVINYDIPNSPDYYIHRIGRTGRAGKLGIAYSIANSEMQVKDLKDYAKSKNLTITEEICYLSKGSQTGINDVKNDDKLNKTFGKRNFGNDKSKFDRKSHGEERPRFERNDKRKSYDRDKKSRFNEDRKDGFSRDRKPRFDGERQPGFSRDRKPRFEKNEKRNGLDRDRRPKFDGERKNGFDRDRKTRFGNDIKPSFDRNNNRRDNYSKSGYGRKKSYRTNEFNDEGRDVFIIRTNKSHGKNENSFAKNDRDDRKEKSYSKFNHDNGNGQRKSYNKFNKHERFEKNETDIKNFHGKKRFEHNNEKSDKPNFKKNFKKEFGKKNFHNERNNRFQNNK